jgi:hypothetical protein
LRFPGHRGQVGAAWNRYGFTAFSSEQQEKRTVKPILAVIGGFVLSFGMFVAGILFALFVMIDEPPQAQSPLNMADVWSSEPRTVNVEAQAFERLPAAKQGNEVSAEGAKAADGAGAAVTAAQAEPAVDTMTTAALPADAMPGEESQGEEPVVEDRAAARLFTAHADWCSRRYRSYDAGTNSYSPYNGGRRECMSPYWAEYAKLTGAVTQESNERFVPLADAWSDDSAQAEEPSQLLEYVFDDTGQDTGLLIDDHHVRECFSRYRSYRPEDNTYQPWGGGPRMQCE